MPYGNRRSNGREDREFDNNNRFSLWENDNQREGKRDAHFTGTITIDGREYWMNMWENEGGNGRSPVFSGTIREKEDRPQRRSYSGRGRDDDGGGRRFGRAGRDDGDRGRDDRSDRGGRERDDRSPPPDLDEDIPF